MNTPLVSVAMATYNGEKFLKDQMDSLLAQTYRHFEVVISDDGSTDRTQEIIKGYQTRDARVRFSVNLKPEGYIRNFERALSLCRGEIIFLCDQDDVWHTDKIKRHMQVYQEQKTLWAYNRVALIDESTQRIGLLENTISTYYSKRKLLQYTWGSCILGCATSYRASLLKNIWPADPLAPAHDSWIQLAIYPAQSAYIPEILQEYRQHRNNTTGLKNKVTESEAISQNMKYLKNLVHNSHLSITKRFFFLLVVCLKNIRNGLKNLIAFS